MSIKQVIIKDFDAFEADLKALYGEVESELAAVFIAKHTAPVTTSPESISAAATPETIADSSAGEASSASSVVGSSTISGDAV